MYIFGSGGPRGDAASSPRANTRKTRAGWWFWGPFLFGLFFTVGGIAGLAGAAAVPAAASGLGTAGAVWLFMGLGSLGVAWWVWRDIHSDDEPSPTEVASDESADLDAQLRVTGVPGTAKIKGYKYLAGSSFGGSALVELDLELTTTLGGSVPIEHQTRVPLAFTDKLAVGASVPVIVSSTDPSKMIIEWTGFVGPPPDAIVVPPSTATTAAATQPTPAPPATQATPAPPAAPAAPASPPTRTAS
jgi:hypothetical protein